MAVVPNLETPFRRTARRLITPAGRRFDPAAWERALADIEAPTESDRALLEAALWVGREMAAHTASLPDRFPGLTSAQAMTLGVAALNFEYRRSLHALRGEQARLDPGTPVSFDYYAHLAYANAGGQRLSQSDFGEAGVEALASWLFDAARIESQEAPVTIATVTRIVGDALRFYSLRAAMKSQFDKALHLGARLAPDRDDHWEPHDRDLSRLHHAWHARAETEVLTAVVHLRAEWPTLSPAERRRRLPPRSVDEARAAPGGSRLIVKRRECGSRRPPLAAIERRAAEQSWFGCFLNDDMPLAPGLSVALLADAWQVIGDSCRRLFDLAVRCPELQTAGGWAAAVKRSELVRALMRTLAVDEFRADAIIEFLTFAESGSAVASSPTPNAPTAATRRKKGERGLWAAPIITIPGEKVLLLPQTVFEIGSLIYRLEAWLERGGIDDEALDHRGDRYERHLRRELAGAIRSNPVFTTARIASDGIDRTAGFPHQIDLLLRLGDRLFVGEIKCFLTPADPHQWDRFYREKLPGAAQQVRLRAAWLDQNRGAIVAALGINRSEADALIIEPIIVLNIGAGFSLEVDGCRVVHADFLLSYLRNPVMESGAVTYAGKPVRSRLVTLYNSEREAGNRFNAAMAAPWPLRRFLDRLGWEETPYPRPTGGGFTIGSPARGNLYLKRGGALW